MDWNAIREEYIRDESSSYRKLAQKYGVGLTAITKHAKDENWIEQRKQVKDKTITKSLEKISDKQAERAAKFMALTDTLTEKLIKAFEVVDPTDTQGIRQLTASLRDLKEMQGVKSELDTKEQRARIANLEKQAEKDDDIVNEIKVVFAAGPEEWNE